MVAERCPGLRRGNAKSLDAAARAYASQSLRIRRDPHGGILTITVELPMDSSDVEASDRGTPATGLFY
jgi:hypothetical protein